MSAVNTKLILSIFVASIAALGNIPYGYRFAYSIFTFSDQYVSVFGYIFATSAVLANIALGGYSLMSIKKEDILEQKRYIVMLSVMGAIPLGFINFLGYLNSIPIYINIGLSIIIAFVNAGIGFRALLNVLEVFRNINEGFKKTYGEIVLRIIGFCAGVSVSTVGYVAATASLIMLFMYYQMDISLAKKLSYCLALFTWIPYAALFAHSTQHVMGDIYKSSVSGKKQRSSSTNKYLSIFLIVLSLLSASSIAQMVFELFKPENNIPEFLKNEYMQLFIYNLLAPIAFLSSASVNYFALMNLKKYMGF